MDTGALAA